MCYTLRVGEGEAERVSDFGLCSFANRIVEAELRQGVRGAPGPVFSHPSWTEFLTQRAVIATLGIKPPEAPREKYQRLCVDARDGSGHVLKLNETLATARELAVHLLTLQELGVVSARVTVQTSGSRITITPRRHMPGRSSGWIPSQNHARTYQFPGQASEAIGFVDRCFCYRPRAYLSGAWRQGGPVLPALPVAEKK